VVRLEYLGSSVLAPRLARSGCAARCALALERAERKGEMSVLIFIVNFIFGKQIKLELFDTISGYRIVSVETKRTSDGTDTITVMFEKTDTRSRLLHCWANLIKSEKKQGEA